MREDLKLIAMQGYSTFPSALELEFHFRMHFTVIPKILFSEQWNRDSTSNGLQNWSLTIGCSLVLYLWCFPPFYGGVLILCSEYSRYILILADRYDNLIVSILTMLKNISSTLTRIATLDPSAHESKGNEKVILHSFVLQN